ncbi:RNA/RNP complex-1-interacting phosphatase-like [Stylophora pistillata]|uniref:RNA/RNP complex-1-interacting phosphatase-like n=1 Tax=Stylophora pistillata TaxID=50429 RepID=UPI000C04D48B|nr:RNA/RNP complex-1-interacting phosphatase-like [Stylophora pistillata]
MFRFSLHLPGFVYLESLLSLNSLRFCRKMNTEVVIDKRIPDKWRDYKPCGVPIEGEKIIAFKTPLSHQYDNESDQDNGIKTYERFTPMDLVNHLSQKHIKLGMVVDFTNTYRYYNSKELFDHGILYRKIKCVGKEIPDENVVERFKTDVCTFLNKKSNSDSVVGVHCTHGLNRSGYVVCRYLIECRGYTPEDAIKEYGANTFYPEVDYDSDSKMRIFDDLMKYTMQQNDYNSGTQLNPNNFNALFGVIYFDLTAQPEKVTKDPKKLI